MRFIALFVLALSLVACSSEDPPEPDTPLGELASSREPGVASANSLVRVDVRGTLEDGTVFQEADRILVPLAGMTPGFARGVAGMREGETKTFVVSPEEGYRDNAPDGIPPNTVLTYEVTLHNIQR